MLGATGLGPVTGTGCSALTLAPAQQHLCLDLHLGGGGRQTRKWGEAASGSWAHPQPCLLWGPAPGKPVRS